MEKRKTVVTKKEKENLSTRQIVSMVILLVCIAVVTWVFNVFRLRQVNFEGLTRYTETEFREKLEDNILYTLTPFFCMQDTWKQKTIPFIECYEIEYINSQTARVIVHEKRVTGGVLLMGRYMYFDKDGIVVETSTERLPDVPLITGLVFNEIVLYQKLSVQKDSLFDVILQLTRLIEQNEITVEEISFNSNYEVTLYSGANTILLGKRTTYDEQINALQGILSAMQEHTGTLDMKNYSKDNSDVILN